MSCDKFDERLQQLLDQRLEPADDRELQHHAQQCADCRSLLEAQRRLFSAFECDPYGRTGLTDNFAEKVVTAFVAEQPPVRSWGQKAWAGALVAVAALLLLALLPGLRPITNHRVSPAPSTNNVVENAAPIVPTVAVPKYVSHETSPASEPLGTNAVASLPPPGQGTNDWIDNLRESISEVSLENLEPMDQIADGFRPVATSLQSAVGVLRRTLPGGGENRHKPMPAASGMWNNGLDVHV